MESIPFVCRSFQFFAGSEYLKGKNVKKKTVYGILLVIVLLTILLLTLQGPEGTVKLSETLRLQLEKIGYKTDFHSFRSNAHLPVYFFLGVVLSLFGRACGWRWWIVVTLGCGFGLLDEGIKVLLPTREFDAVDLVKDWIGIGLGAAAVWMLQKRRK